jgi:hypothetical protein
VRSLTARLLVFSFAGLAIFVQLAVWGATKIRSEGALLESWQPYFGWEYGIAFACAQLGVCWWFGIDGGPRWLLCTWAIGGALAVLAWWIGGRDGPLLDDGVALVAGLGAVVLAVGLYDNRLAPRSGS